MYPTLLPKILRNLLPRHLNDRRILHGSRHLDLLIKLVMHSIIQQLPQNSPERLTGASLRYHTLTLDRTTEGSDGADLAADETLDLFEDLVGDDGRVGVVVLGEGDEGEWELAFEFVGDADYATFGDLGG